MQLWINDQMDHHYHNAFRNGTCICIYRQIEVQFLSECVRVCVCVVTLSVGDPEPWRTTELSSHCAAKDNLSVVLLCSHGNITAVSSRVQSAYRY